MSLIAIPTPFTVRFDKLQADEIYDAHAVADFAAKWVEEGGLERMAPVRRSDWIYRTTAYLRGRHKAWRVRAMEQAVQSVHDTILAGDVGALFCQMAPEKRHAIARALALAAVGSHQGFLEGTSAITPGQYLQIHDEMKAGDR